MDEESKPSQGGKMRREVLEKLLKEFTSKGGQIRKVGFPSKLKNRNWSGVFQDYTTKKRGKKRE